MLITRLEDSAAIRWYNMLACWRSLRYRWEQSVRAFQVPFAVYGGEYSARVEPFQADDVALAKRRHFRSSASTWVEWLTVLSSAVWTDTTTSCASDDIEGKMAGM